MELLFVALVIFILVSLALPWFMLSRLSRIEERLQRLEQRPALPAHVADPPVARAPARHGDIEFAPPPIVPDYFGKKPSTTVTDVSEPDWTTGASESFTIRAAAAKPKATAAPASHAPAPPRPGQKDGFEWQFGLRLPVWGGGIALICSVFFLIRYSIENGLLGPLPRLILGSLFGLGLLGFAHWLRGRPQRVSDPRIAQALCGAGIADLYLCIFAATRLYHFLPEGLGFLLMAAVTAGAVLLALRHGPPIALLGLIGGFATPALLGSHESNIAMLLAYLFVLACGLLIVATRAGWAWLAVPTMAATYLWLLVCLFGSPSDAPGLHWVGPFLVAFTALVVVLHGSRWENAPAPWMRWWRYATLLGAVLFSGALLAITGFGLFEWGMIGLLSLGGIVLAWRKPELYLIAPWMTALLSWSLLALWKDGTPALHLTLLAGFGALHAVAAALAARKSPRAVDWVQLAAAASLGFYLLAYGLLGHLLPGDFRWGLAALALALLAAETARHHLRHPLADAAKQSDLLTLAVLTASAFVAIGLAIVVTRDYLATALAMQVFATVLLQRRWQLAGLEQVLSLLAVAVTVVLLVMMSEPKPGYDLLDMLSGHGRLRVTNVIPWRELGLPALFLVLAAIARGSRRGFPSIMFEWLSVGLIAWLVYLATRQVFFGNDFTQMQLSTIYSRGSYTNLLMLSAIGLMAWAAAHRRQGFVMVGSAVLLFALVRIGWFDLLQYNPLLRQVDVGDTIILNGLLLSFGLPALWIGLVRRFGRLEEEHAKIASALVVFLLFTWLSLNLRLVFQGHYLNDGPTGNAEMYSYSALWLVFGLGLLITGTLTSERTLRIASLAIILLSVGKVFLYDVSELDGLYRVFSFLGLGVSLIGLSWFYTRYVFRAPQ